MFPTSAAQDSLYATRIASLPVLQASVVWGTSGRNPARPGTTAIKTGTTIPGLRGFCIQGSASSFGGNHPLPNTLVQWPREERRYVAG
jgi:hypothetical protein